MHSFKILSGMVESQSLRDSRNRVDGCLQRTHQQIFLILFRSTLKCDYVGYAGPPKPVPLSWRPYQWCSSEHSMSVVSKQGYPILRGQCTWGGRIMVFTIGTWMCLHLLRLEILKWKCQESNGRFLVREVHVNKSKWGRKFHASR